MNPIKSKTGLEILFDPITNLSRKTSTSYLSPSTTFGEVILKYRSIILVILLIVLFIGLFFYYKKLSDKGSTAVSTVVNEKEMQAEKMRIRYEKWISDSKFSIKSWDTLKKSLKPTQQYLINFQPLTAHVGGYLGPFLPEPGYFDAEKYIQLALRLGVRSFVLPISIYVDDNKRPPLWPVSKDPAIVFRDESGTIVSRNATTVKDIIKALVAFNSQSGIQSKEPILLYIVEDTKFLPDKSTEESSYVEIMSKIANELNGIPKGRRLTMLGASGSAVNGMNERNILTRTKLEELENKILIFTDFDIGIYGKDVYKSKQLTLGEFTNFQLLPATASGQGQGQGTTVVSSSSTGRATKTLKLQDVIGSKAAWPDQTRVDWHATLQDAPFQIPSTQNVSEGMGKGLQAIPLPLFFNTEQEAMKQLKSLWSLWGGFAFRVKENSLRFTAPQPVVPAKPSDNLNARVNPELEPGQVNIS